MSTPRFFSTPLRYLRWVSFEKPAIFYSIVVGSLGPVFMVVVPPVRRRLGDGPREQIPLTYPSKLILSPAFPLGASGLEGVFGLEGLCGGGEREVEG